VSYINNLKARIELLEAERKEARSALKPRGPQDHLEWRLETAEVFCSAVKMLTVKSADAPRPSQGDTQGG
jgi:hypothetical protein